MLFTSVELHFYVINGKGHTFAYYVINDQIYEPLTHDKCNWQHDHVRKRMSI